MTNPYVVPLSLVVFLPALGALALAFFRKDRPETVKRFALFITILTFLLSVWMALPASEKFKIGTAGMQDMFSIPWISSFSINYFMGMDGISFPLVILTTFVSMLAMGASWPITKSVKAYCILFQLRAPQVE